MLALDAEQSNNRLSLIMYFVSYCTFDSFAQLLCFLHSRNIRWEKSIYIGEKIEILWKKKKILLEVTAQYCFVCKSMKWEIYIIRENWKIIINFFVGLLILRVFFWRAMFDIHVEAKNHYVPLSFGWFSCNSNSIFTYGIKTWTFERNHISTKTIRILFISYSQSAKYEKSCVELLFLVALFTSVSNIGRQYYLLIVNNRHTHTRTNLLKRDVINVDSEKWTHFGSDMLSSESSR